MKEICYNTKKFTCLISIHSHCELTLKQRVYPTPLDMICYFLGTILLICCTICYHLFSYEPCPLLFLFLNHFNDTSLPWSAHFLVDLIVSLGAIPNMNFCIGLHKCNKRETNSKNFYTISLVYNKFNMCKILFPLI